MSESNLHNVYLGLLLQSRIVIVADSELFSLVQ